MKQIKLSSLIVNEDGVDYIKQALRNLETSNYGKNLKRFETQLKEYLNDKSEIALINSGTSSLHLALINLGVENGDEVICQSFTFVASAFPILYQKAIPIFVDSEPDTWNMCPINLEDAIKDRIKKGKKPKAIIMVYSYGMPAKINEIITLSLKYDIPIIEDAAEALGSQYNGGKCGTFGRYGVLSFNGNKIITTSGGGALICKDQEEKEKILFLANQSKENKPYYEHKQIGYNYSMSNIIAGIGCAQMSILDTNIKKRRAINNFYKDLFRNIRGITLLKEPDNDFFSNHWLTCILIENSITGFSNEDLRKELLKHNIESRLLWKPLHTQPVFKDTFFYGQKTCESLFEKGLCLPSGSDLTAEDKTYISEKILDYIKKINLEK